MHKTIDTMQVRKQLGSILDEVFYNKETITIERKGKAMAALVPVEFLEQGNKREGELRKSFKQSIVDKIQKLPTKKVNENPTETLRILRKENTKKLKKKYGK